MRTEKRLPTMNRQVEDGFPAGDVIQTNPAETRLTEQDLVATSPPVTRVA